MVVAKSGIGMLQCNEGLREWWCGRCSVRLKIFGEKFSFVRKHRTSGGGRTTDSHWTSGDGRTSGAWAISGTGLTRVFEVEVAKLV